MSNSSEPAVRVDLQVRHTILPGGATTTVFSAPCPADGRSHALAECMACPKCKSLVVDPGARTAALVCVDVPAPELRTVSIASAMTRRVMCFAAEASVDEVVGQLLARPLRSEGV